MIQTNKMLDYLREIKTIHWNDFKKSTEICKSILNNLYENQQFIKYLIDRLDTDEKLFSMCEEDEFRQKLVLYNSEKQGFRIRLHKWKTDFKDCIHAHRFSYVSKILSGGYEHTLYKTPNELYPSGVEQIIEKKIDSKDNFIRTNIPLDEIKPILIFNVNQGDIYSQENSLLSSTITKKNTVTLFIRGISVRPFSFQYRPHENIVIWKGGSEYISIQNREQLRMSKEKFKKLKISLQNLHII